MKLNLVIGYFDGDKDLACEVIDQCGKLLSEKSEIASLTYLYRFDSSPPSEEILERDRKKFTKVETHRSRYKMLGWPQGCNGLAYSVLNHILPESDKECECALILESDCVLTRPNWDVEMWNEWEKAKADKKIICGTVLPWAYPPNVMGSHVNASAMWGRATRDFIKPIQDGTPEGIAWDWFYGSNTSLLAYDSPLFKLDWKRDTITSQELFASNALCFHGVKDSSARDAVNEKYKL